MRGVIVLLLGCAFVFAGLAKLRRPAPFVATLRRLMPDGRARLAAVAVPAVEIALGVVLLSGRAGRGATAGAILLLLAFSAVLLRMWLRGVRGCGCFGEASDSAASGLARNALLIAAAAYVIADDAPLRVYADAAPARAGQFAAVVGVACAWPGIVAVARRRRPLPDSGKAA
jgi:uncharacterized membrane protein